MREISAKGSSMGTEGSNLTQEMITRAISTTARNTARENMSLAMEMSMKANTSMTNVRTRTAEFSWPQVQAMKEVSRITSSTGGAG